MTTKSAETIQPEQETLLRSLAERLESRGYEDLRVSRLREFEGRRPRIIFWADTDSGFIPDASAMKNGATFIFQVESADTLQGKSASEKMALFSAYARHYRRHYCLVIPEKAEEEGRKALMSHSLDERFVHVVLV